MAGDPYRLVRTRDLARWRERLRRLVRGAERPAPFLRGYLAGAEDRVCWNLALLSRLLRPGMRWLDVGSFGVETLLIQEAIPGVEVVSTSYEGDALSIAADGTITAGLLPGAPQVVIKRCDVEREPLPVPDGHVDLVTCFEILEHLKFTPWPLLAQLRRVLAPDGQLLLTTPNITSFRSVARAIVGLNPHENPFYHRNPDYGVVHPKEYAPAEVAGLLHAGGFRLLGLSTRTFRWRGVARAAGQVAFAAVRGLTSLAVRRPGGVFVGENIVALAVRGGDPVGELPASVFEPT